MNVLLKVITDMKWKDFFFAEVVSTNKTELGKNQPFSYNLLD